MNFSSLLSTVALGFVAIFMAGGLPVDIAKESVRSSQPTSISKGVFAVDLATVLRTQKSTTCLLVDLRSPALFSKLHADGAVNVPMGTLSNASASVLKQMSEASVVFLYCEDSSCASQGAASVVEYHKNNMRHVAFYTGGIREWTSAGLPVNSSEGTLPQQGSDKK